MSDVSELVMNWVDDILAPDIDWSTYHELLSEDVEDWDHLSDDERDALATKVERGIADRLKVARQALVAEGLL